MKKYELKFEPGYHYTEAYKAISSMEYGIISKNPDTGDIEGSGTISTKQAEELLLREDVEIIDDGHSKEFLLDMEEFEKYTEDYKRQKDEYIIKNQIHLKGLNGDLLPDNAQTHLKPKKKKKTKSITP